MSTLRSVTITDDTGTRYTDLFDDVALDDYEILRSTTGIRGVDAIVPADPFAPRASADGPLGALILRWAQAHVDGPSYIHQLAVHRRARHPHRGDRQHQHPRAALREPVRTRHRRTPRLPPPRARGRAGPADRAHLRVTP